MKSNMASRRQVLLPALVALMFVTASVSVYRVMGKKADEKAIDLYSYWYAGHFVWQGRDPYQASLQNQAPYLPVHYLDGPTVTEGRVGRADVQAMPANTAPVVLIMALLSRLSWPTAATIWRFLNLGFCFAITWQVMRLMDRPLLSLHGLLLLLIIFSLIATREAIETGQTTLLVLVCMLGAVVLGPSRPIVAGILLGIALSKYSLTFPAFLLFVYKKWYTSALTSLAVQLVGLVAITLIGGTAPQNVLASYLQILTLHTDLPGMHLASVLKSQGAITYLIIGLISIGLLTVLAYWYRRNSYAHVSHNTTRVDVLLLTIVMLWNLLTFYHRRYDHVAAILYIGFILAVIGAESGTFTLQSKWRLGLYALTGACLAVWALPLYIVTGLAAYTWLFNLGCLAALGTCVALLFRTNPSHVYRP